MHLAWRYVVIILLSIGMAIIYGLKVNFSVAIVSMVNQTAISDNKTQSNNTDKEDGPYVWTKDMQGNLLSSYFWGYLAAMIPGSQVAEVVSAKWVFFFAVALDMVCTLATPISCDISYWLVLALRVLIGVGGGVTFPTSHVLLARWAPPDERGAMSSIAFSGTVLGTVLSNYLSGVIIVNLSWKWVFYIMGAGCSVWLVAWVIFVTDRPRQLKFMSDKEKEFLETALGPDEEKGVKHVIPWKSIAKSMHFWAILIAHVCSNWGFYLLLLNMPLFMTGILNFNVSETSTYTAIPFFIMWVFSIVLGEMFDHLKKAGKISLTKARKIATLLGSVPPMACLGAICFIGASNRVLVVILLTVTLTCMGGMYSGFLANHIDIAPRFAGTLMGMTNAMATVPGIVGPIFVGQLTKKDPTMNAWIMIFGVTCGFFAVEAIVYTIFGTAEEQSWNNPQEPKT